MGIVPVMMFSASPGDYGNGPVTRMLPSRCPLFRRVRLFFSYIPFSQMGSAYVSCALTGRGRVDPLHGFWSEPHSPCDAINNCSANVPNLNLSLTLKVKAVLQLKGGC